MNFLKRICGTKKRAIGFLVFSFLSVSLMVTIFCFSAQPAEISQNTSDGFFATVEAIVAKLYGGAVPPTVDAMLLDFHAILRKLAHGFVYFLLGGCLTASFCCTLFFKKLWKKGLCAASIAVFYAITDEVHQLFVPGRSGEVRDVLIDSLGVLVGVSIMLFSVALAKKRKIRKDK